MTDREIYDGFLFAMFHMGINEFNFNQLCPNRFGLHQTQTSGLVHWEVTAPQTNWRSKDFTGRLRYLDTLGPASGHVYLNTVYT